MLKSVSSITNAIGALNYKGTWNASTNTPTLADGTGEKGDYYVVSVAGTQTFGGILLIFGVGDWIVYNGSVWQRVEGGADGNFVNLSVSGTAVISDNSASAALRITQIGAGNALLVEDSANPDATPVVIDNGGNLILGATTLASTPSTFYSTIQSHSAANQSLGIGLFNYSTGVAARGDLAFYKSLSGTSGTLSAVSTNTDIGSLNFFGAGDASTWVRAGIILAEVDTGTISATSMPGRLVFATTPDGSATSVERMRIDSAGRVGIGASTTAGIFVNIGPTLTGSTSVVNVRAINTIASDVTSSAAIFRTQPFTQAAAFTLGALTHYEATQGTIGATSAIANQYGFSVNSTLSGATNNYGFYSSIASGAGRFNFYAQGTAANVFVGTTSIGGLVGSESLRVTPVASAVNYFNMQGSTTGNTPQLAVQGSDTNIQFAATSKGTAALNFFTNAFGQQQFSITHTASAVNYLQATGSATGAAATLSAQGTDTNIDIALTPKGTGVVQYGTYTAGVVAQTGYITIKDAGGTTRRLLVG